jgi:molybdopterin-containing oxidoreductase family iron-sulfur binding subunit
MKKSLDLSSLRKLLSGERGARYWRSLEEAAGTPEFEEYLHAEFPRFGSAMDNSVNRRRFLQLMGASIALAGLPGCVKQPDEKIVPYVNQPETLVPGEPAYFSTAMPLDGYGHGVIVTSNMGRPTKIEGNADHPASLGATSVFAQASLLTLYDPDRSQVITHQGMIGTWANFLSAVDPVLGAQRSREGAGLRILSETVTSPTLAAQLKDLLSKFPKAQWHQYTPMNADAEREGTRLAFGEMLAPVYSFDKAAVIVSLDADFLVEGSQSVRAMRDFSRRRRISSEKKSMNRLYVAESMVTNTGSMADHRLPIRSGQIGQLARSIAARLRIAGIEEDKRLPDTRVDKWIEAVAKDLDKSRGSSIVIAGRHQPPVVHALAHTVNYHLGNAGKTVQYIDPAEARPELQLESLRQLVLEMNSGEVELLLILGGNPAYTAPADFKFAEALKKVSMSIRLGLYDDETSAECNWHIPETHYLESWSDIRSSDGTVSILQPLIAPLYDGKSSHELIATLTDSSITKPYDIVRSAWQVRHEEAGFEKFWVDALNKGVVNGTAQAPKDVRLATGLQFAGLAENYSAIDSSRLELVYRPDPTIWDGQYANNGWMQELAKPITKLTWDNAALMAPATAEKLSQQLSVHNGDVIELEAEGRSVKAPVWIVPGHAENSITLHLGYGRTKSGNIGTGIGVNAYALLTSTHPGFTPNVKVRTTGERYDLATTQQHHAMEGRDQVRSAPLETFNGDPMFAKKLDPEPSPDQTLYPKVAYDGYAWGMSIDLNSCTGCNACVIACQSENNIPIVGKEQVMNMREMQWIRVDSYFKGELDNPEIYHQPVPCMHCENAPCEPVCPVGATVHDSEGLNVMVYNRCIGTRYCSNNCPYKVRRFNFFEYNEPKAATLKMLENPDVSVRSRGVMEKCTYCVQRINEVRIRAEKDGRQIRDGEVKTACQTACPAEAIVFGDINNDQSAVTKLKAEPRTYSLLAELNTKPRTTYLAKITNPNPEMNGKS